MNNTGTPATVRQAIVTRQVQAAKTPVYTTETKQREHLMAVELEFTEGGRFWDHMADSQVSAYIEARKGYTYVSDVDHSALCWCMKK